MLWTLAKVYERFNTSIQFLSFTKRIDNYGGPIVIPLDMYIYLGPTLNLSVKVKNLAFVTLTINTYDRFSMKN